MNDTTYNGWTNWETWNTALWLGNEYCMYVAVKEARFDGMRDSDAERIVREVMPEGTPDMHSEDEYTEVNWTEIRNCIEEL